MQTAPRSPQSIDEYIADFPEPTRLLLEKIRMTIRAEAPAAQEKISYGIPAFTLHGNLIYFAGYKNHVSVYPAPRGAGEFKDELSRYQGGKGTVRFPLDQPIPYDLIARIVRFRLQENERKAKGKQNQG